MTDAEYINLHDSNFVREIDGIFYWYPPENNNGCFAAHTLYAIADELKKRNSDYDQPRNHH